MNNQKVILITGASTGLGRVAAIELSLQGHKVYATDSDFSYLEPLMAYGVMPIELNIESEKASQWVVQSVIDKEGGIDVLINNVNLVLKESEEQEGYPYDPNLFGLATMTKIVLSHMRLRRRGKVMNIAATISAKQVRLGAPGHLRDLAMKTWSEGVKRDAAVDGIEVVLIKPRHGMTDEALEGHRLTRKVMQVSSRSRLARRASAKMLKLYQRVLRLIRRFLLKEVEVVKGLR